MKNEAKLGSGPIDFVEMAGQMARKCEEVFEKRAHSPVENNDAAICSHLPVPKGSGAFCRLPRRRGLKMLTFPSPPLLTFDKNRPDHFNEINRS